MAISPAGINAVRPPVTGPIGPAGPGPTNPGPTDDGPRDTVSISPEAQETQLADDGSRCGSDWRCYQQLIKRGLLT